MLVLSLVIGHYYYFALPPYHVYFMTIIILENALNENQIQVLQRDCGLTLDMLSKNSSDLKTELESRSCSLDIFEDESIPENAEIRSCMDLYLKRRFELNGLSLSSDQKTIQDIVFSLIPSLIRRTTSNKNMYLFNENYIVKPSGSDVAFRWHTDANEQLACIAAQERKEYFSCWCPLDYTNETNGTLVVQEDADVMTFDAGEMKDDIQMESRSHSRRNRRRKEQSGNEVALNDTILLREAASDEIDMHKWKGKTLYINKGSIVLFSSNEWHCSGPNKSACPRRVFYAQYSTSPITMPSARRGTIADISKHQGFMDENESKHPLCFAIPCDLFGS